jgi:hypothetical protein
MNQFAEKTNDGLLPQCGELSPESLERHRDRRYRRGGTLASDMAYFLLEYRGLAGTTGPTEAMPRRQL